MFKVESTVTMIIHGKLTWRLVFNSDLKAWDFNEAIKTARKAGYKYISKGPFVYAVPEQGVIDFAVAQSIELVGNLDRN